jgi:hypothetical protein
MTSPPHRHCRRHQRQQARVQLKRQRQAKELKRQRLEQRQLREDRQVLAMLLFRNTESSHMIWPTFVPNFRGPRPSPKPAKSPTSIPMKPSTSRRPTTSTPSSGSFSRRRAGLRGPTRRGSIPFSQRKRISTPNHRLLIQFIIILCSLPVILTDPNIQSTSDFHLIFEEIGLMASSTDYQLATMKVNLTLLENTVYAFRTTIIAQKEFIEKIAPPIYQQRELLIPVRFNNHTKDKLLANTKSRLNDANALVYKVQQIKEVLPKMKPHDINKIKADYRERQSVFSILWGLLGTYRGMMTNRKYDKMKVQLDKTHSLVSPIVNVVNNQGKTLDLINQDLEHIRTQISYDHLINSLDTETNFRSAHFQLNAEIDRIKTALQCAQWRRLSLDFLSSKQLDSLYQTMVTESKLAETELLVSQPSDLLQLELSYFYNGEMVTVLLHVPTVPHGSILRLVKLHPFPLPISGNYSIVPDVDAQILAMSVSGTEMSLQFPAVNLLGCGQASHVYLC